MKNFIKLLLITFITLLFFSGKEVMAADFTYYYGDGCSHCYEVDKYFKKNDIYKKYDVEKKEVYQNRTNSSELLKIGAELGLSQGHIGVPFMVYNENKSYLKGDKDIIDYFKEKVENTLVMPIADNTCSIAEEEPCEEEENAEGFWKFFLILLPAALSDSINPCAFAVLFLLLSSILSKTTSFRRTIYCGLLFSLAIFISYYLMGVGLYKVFSFSNQIFYIKLGVGILGILVGLANIKDYFFYGKGFVMEVPFSWRPKMKKVLKGIGSPTGSFIAGFIVSLFLLPCTSGPYFTILGYLAAESSSINLMGYFYLLIYNLIFIIPMIIITFVIGLGVKDVAELKELKETHKENIHLIVGIMMLGLGLYLLWEVLV